MSDLNSLGPHMTHMAGSVAVPPQPAATTSAMEQRHSEAAQILMHAAKIVAGDREAQHGPKERNHENIATLWRAYMQLKIVNGEDLMLLTSYDVATMMELLKIARRFAGSGRTNPDNYVDGAGYCSIAGEIALNGGER